MGDIGGVEFADGIEDAPSSIGSQEFCELDLALLARAA